MNDNDDEGFIDTKESNMILDKKNVLSHQSITSKSIHNKPSHYPRATRNPYDDGLLFIYFSLPLLHDSYSEKTSGNR
jgi:hypothetical protein